MSVASIDGLNLHYWRVGQGPDVVFIHGLCGNLAVWHLRIVPFLEREFRLTTYDLRGHGRSGMPPSGYTTLDMAEDLHGLLDSLAMREVCLVGHSFGADIALHFALRHPERVRRLALLEAGLAVTLEERKRDAWAGWGYWVSKLEEAGIAVPAERRSDFRYLLNLSLDTPRFYGPARSLPRKREPLLRLINETSIVADYERAAGMTREAIASVRTPTLVVYGEHSYFMGSYRLLGELLPQRELVLLPGGEHFGPLEQPELLVEHLRSFFTADALTMPERATA